ncbi:hypothetical protein MKZ38_004486 [Zalerion maritima]|uniref:Uncharacterized protein n=1 Tax=Zalerion maritima TaxID=339359 RepID=A0AAD5RLY4_9PEZI|nr:hypothetical protein MKZ38_004486 [Zalerion maritima]
MLPGSIHTQIIPPDDPAQQQPYPNAFVFPECAKLLRTAWRAQAVDGATEDQSRTAANDDTSDTEGEETHEEGEPTGQVQYWDLSGELDRNQEVFSGLEPEVRKEKCDKLAQILELRTIFTLAFLYLHPDSSDVYMMQGEHVGMPIA